MRRLLPLLLAALTLAGPGVAGAAWSVDAVGASRAAGGVLAPPSATSVTWDPTVHVTWTGTTSSWASGHRILRAVAPDGPFSPVAEVPLGVSTTDDTPGAGTHYYAVVAYRGSWTSPAGPVAARSDRTYVITGAAPTSTAGCAAGTHTLGMQQGFVPTGAGVSATMGTTTFSLCTDTWTAGQSLPAGTTTMKAYVANTNPKPCSVVVEVTTGGTTLGSATAEIPGNHPVSSPLSWSLPTSSVTFSGTEQVTVSLRPQGGGGCNTSTIYAGGDTTPASVTLTG